MDSVKLRGVKTNKAKPALKQSLLQKIANGFFGFLEKIVVLVFALRLIFKMFMALDSSVEHYKGLATVVASRHVVFVVGNVIVLVLLMTSGKLLHRGSDSNTSTDSIYEEFLEKRKRRHGIVRLELENREKHSSNEHRATESQKNKPKQSISVNRAIQSTSENRTKQSPSENRVNQSSAGNRAKESTGENKEKQSSLESKIYRRTQSEKSSTPCKSSYGNLRRSKTEKFEERVDPDESIIKPWYPEDDMSEVEFLNKIEAFIARQRRFRMDEECCVC